MRRWAVCALTLWVALGSRAVLHAQEATEAQMLFERGAELYRARRFGEALEAMVASNRLVPNANVVFNVAQIYELLDRPIDAFNWYQRQLGFALEGQARARTEERVAKLLPRVAVVKIETQPTQAELYVDRIELGVVGHSPCRIAVLAGEHLVIARLEGYREVKQPVSIVVGGVSEVTLELPRAMGKVELDSEPQGAVVLREGDSEPLGNTPLALELPVGVAKLTLQLEGYVERRIELRVDPSVPARSRVRLSHDSARLASLIVSTKPKGASVRLDHREAEPAPASFPGLSPGPHALALSRADYEPWAINLQLTAGSTTRVQADLIADADKPWPYRFWLGYGSGAAVFAAGASVGVAAVVKNNDGGSASTVRNLNHLADALMGAGIVVAAATLIWQLTADPPRHSSGSVSTRAQGKP